MVSNSKRNRSPYFSSGRSNENKKRFANRYASRETESKRSFRDFTQSIKGLFSIRDNNETISSSSDSVKGSISSLRNKRLSELQYTVPRSAKEINIIGDDSNSSNIKDKTKNRYT